MTTDRTTTTVPQRRSETSGLDRLIWSVIVIQAIVFVSQVLRYFGADLPLNVQPLTPLVIGLYVIAAVTFALTVMTFLRRGRVGTLCLASLFIAMVGSNVSAASGLTDVRTGTAIMTGLAIACTVVLSILCMVRTRRRPTYPEKPALNVSPGTFGMADHRPSTPLSNPAGPGNR